MMSRESVVVTYQCLTGDIISDSTRTFHPRVSLGICYVIGLVHSIVGIFRPRLLQVIDIATIVVVREQGTSTQALQRCLPIQCEVGLESSVTLVVFTGVINSIGCGVMRTIITGNIVHIVAIIICIRTIDR